MKIGLKIKLKVSESDKIRIFDTFKAWNTAWQIVSDWSFNSGSTAMMSAHEATYRKVRDTVPGLPANLVQAARTDALAKIKSAKSNHHKLTKAPQIKQSTLRYDTRTCSVKQDGITLAVCDGTRVKATFDPYPRFAEYRNKYKMLSPAVYYSNGNIWATFIFDVPDTQTNNRDIIGLDLGQRNFVATSRGQIYKGRELNRVRRKTRFLKQNLQSRGTKSARRKLRSIRAKEKRQSDYFTHCLTKQILTSIPTSYIGVEKLDLKPHRGPGKKGKNRRKHAVPFGKFVNYLNYKAPFYGKSVLKVNPYMTSQYDCRGLSKGTRDKGRYIGVDGKILNADINAACNIAWKAAAQYGLNNPVVAKNYERQAPVTEPNVLAANRQNNACKSSDLGASLSLEYCNS